jgi:hypothetical protein
MGMPGDRTRIRDLLQTSPPDSSLSRHLDNIPCPVKARDLAGHRPHRRGTAGLRAKGRRRGFRRAGTAVGRLRRDGRPGPLGTRGERDDRRPGVAEPGAGARPHLDPPAQAPGPAMTLVHRMEQMSSHLPTRAYVAWASPRRSVSGPRRGASVRVLLDRRLSLTACGPGDSGSRRCRCPWTFGGRDESC